MQRAYYDMEESYVVPPGAGVTLASLGVPPYSPPAEDWDDQYPVSSVNADGFGAADMSWFGAMPPAAFRTEAPGGISIADMRGARSMARG